MQRVAIAPIGPDTEQQFRKLYGHEAGDALCSYPRTAIQRMAVRVLLAEVLGHVPELSARPDGVPVLVGSPINLSLTHTNGAVGVMLGRGQVGIDVQEVRPKIVAMIDRFLDESEQNWVVENARPHMVATALWSAKEAVYKAMRTEGLPFRDGIVLSGNLFVDGGILASVRHQGHETKLRLSTQALPGMAAAWVFYPNSELKIDPWLSV